MNLMVGHRCPIIHRLNPKDCVDIKNGQLKAIKAALRFSCRHVHALMFEVGFYFWSLNYNHKTNHKGGSNSFGTPMSRHKVHIL